MAETTKVVATYRRDHSGCDQHRFGSARTVSVAASLTPELFPARSTATTVHVFVPANVYGAAWVTPGAPTVNSDPLSWISYSIADCASTSSVDGLHCSMLVPQKSSGGWVAIRSVGVVGGVRSLLASSVTVTTLLFADRLPAESRALTANTCVEPGG